MPRRNDEQLPDGGLLALGVRPDSMGDRARPSSGPLFAIAGGALLVWGAIAAARLRREPPPAAPLPGARVHAG